TRPGPATRSWPGWRSAWSPPAPGPTCCGGRAPSAPPPGPPRRRGPSAPAGTRPPPPRSGAPRRGPPPPPPPERRPQPPLPTPAGAGDALVAGLALGLVSPCPWPDLLRRAAALGAAAVAAPLAGAFDPGVYETVHPLIEIV